MTSIIRPRESEGQGDREGGREGDSESPKPRPKSHKTTKFLTTEKLSTAGQKSESDLG